MEPKKFRFTYTDTKGNTRFKIVEGHENAYIFLTDLLDRIIKGTLTDYDVAVI